MISMIELLSALMLLNSEKLNVISGLFQQNRSVVDVPIRVLCEINKRTAYYWYANTRPEIQSIAHNGANVPPV